MQFTSADIAAMVGTYFWPFVRIAALVTAAPVFSSTFVPVRARLVMALALTAVIAPVIPPVPAVDALSAAGIMMLVEQIIVGVTMGFILHLVFNAFIIGGQIIAMQMGLGFASMVDPQNGAQAPVISMFYILMVTLFFFTMDGHLTLIAIVAQSFTTLPIGEAGIGREGFWQVTRWASQMFAGGVMVALPAVAALLLVHVAMGVMGRAAPQLNIFAVGFALTIIVGFYIMLLSLPSAFSQFDALTAEAFAVMTQLVRGE